MGRFIGMRASTLLYLLAVLPLTQCTPSAPATRFSEPPSPPTLEDFCGADRTDWCLRKVRDVATERPSACAATSAWLAELCRMPQNASECTDDERNSEAPPAAEPSEAVPFDGSRMTHPVKISGAPPMYTAGALRRRAQGVILVSCTVTKAGWAQRCDLIRSLDPDLDAAVLCALSRWRFTPATLDGTAIDVVYTLPYRFQLARP